MIKKSTKGTLLSDLKLIKQNLIENFASRPEMIRIGSDEDKWFLEKAIEFQRNSILYDSLLNAGGIDDDSDPEKTAPLEKIAIELTDIRSAIKKT